MKTLAFDTSTKYLSIACLEERALKTAFHEEVGVKHSEILIPTIKDMLKGLAWKISDIDLVCVGLGPGSFTGLRIAVATVKGLASACKNKVAGVPTMDAMAMNAASDSGLIAPLLDARKGKVYSSIYDYSGAKLKKETDYLLLTIDELLNSLDKKVTFFGDAILKYRDKLDEHPLAAYDEAIDWHPRAVNIGLLGLDKADSGADDPETIDPLYLHAKECNIRGAHNE